MKNINKQAGFTLIELIMVIVILGVLAAFALPRFANLGGDARGATIEALGGAIKAASNIAHSKQLAGGKSAGDSIDLEGATGDGSNVTMDSGYPTANAAGISRAAQVSTDDYAATEASAGDAITYTVAGYDDGADTPVPNPNCFVTYTSPNAVAVETSGC
jgi:MSHA pilin protein MshA